MESELHKFRDSKFEDWLNQTGKAASTRRAYARLAARFGQFVWDRTKAKPSLLLRDTFHGYLKEFVEALQETGLRANSAIFYRRGLASYSEFLEMGKPCFPRLVEVRSEPKLLTDDQYARFLWLVNRLPSIRDRAIIFTCLHAGLSPDELHRLNQSDIEFTQNAVEIRVQHDTRYRRRIVRAGLTLKNLLKEYFQTLLSNGKASDKNDAPLWIAKGKRFECRSIQAMLAEISWVLGFNVSFSHLRNLFLASKAMLDVTELFSHPKDEADFKDLLRRTEKKKLRQLARVSGLSKTKRLSDYRKASLKLVT